MRILCATDFLPKSEAAIERAGLLADELAADLTLLHVAVPTDSGRGLEQTLQWCLAHTKARASPPLWRSRTQPKIVVRAGNPARLIVDTVDQLKAQLLVLGPHRKRLLRDTVEGTIAEKVLVAKRCPLLVVQDEPRGSYGRVLLALDLSGASVSALRAAESLVLTPESRVKIVHAYDTPHEGMLNYAGVGVDSITHYTAGWKREAVNAVRGLLQSEGITRGGYEVAIEEGEPASAILRVVEGFGPDLVVMGTRGRGRLRRALLGSVANRVLHGVGCDVLVVPEGSFRAYRRKGSHRARVSRERERGWGRLAVSAAEVSGGERQGRVGSAVGKLVSGVSRAT